MVKIYACLCGKWECLNNDPHCVIGENMQSPHLWYEEGAKIAAKEFNDITCPEGKDSYYNLDYLKIYFQGKYYRINPIFIQIVTD